MTPTIDLNCDLGEGSPFDAELMGQISSANISCGFHAGSVESVYGALVLAKEHGVVVGAHPGFDDPEHFGRRELTVNLQSIYNLVIYQVSALSGLARELGQSVPYFKPHGALYNMACRTNECARPLVAAAATLGMAIVGLPGSELERASAGRCRFVPEGFADRRYRPDGSLVPRDQPDAFVTDPAEAASQAEALLQGGRIRTLCVHGDNPQAIEFVLLLRNLLANRGIAVRTWQ